MNKKTISTIASILAFGLYIYTNHFQSKEIVRVEKKQTVQSSNSQSEWNISSFPNYYQILGPSEIKSEEFPQVKTVSLKDYKPEKRSNKTVSVSEINYSSLDELGRSGVAYGTITYDMVDISAGTRETWEPNPEPSGWFIYKNKNNSSLISEKDYKSLNSKERKTYSEISNNKKESIKLSNGKTYNGYFYNRSHLIADSLGGRAFRENVVTASRTQNVGNNDKVGGMQYIEWKVMNYIKENKDVVVYYKAEPIYTDSELLPRHVIVSALSSDGVIDEKVKVFNAAEGFSINYLTGEYFKK